MRVLCYLINFTIDKYVCPLSSNVKYQKKFVHGGNCLIIVHGNPRHLCRLNPKKMFTLTLGKYELSGESSTSKCYEMSTLLPTTIAIIII